MDKVILKILSIYKIHKSHFGHLMFKNMTSAFCTAEQSKKGAGIVGFSTAGLLFRL